LDRARFFLVVTRLPLLTLLLLPVEEDAVVVVVVVVVGNRELLRRSVIENCQNFVVEGIPVSRCLFGVLQHQGLID
jgi:hypothetical protein